MSQEKKSSKYGVALIVSGPSGTGKSSVCNALRLKMHEIAFSISCTTRDPRPGEKNGCDYYFISHDEFQQRIKNGEFVEYADVYGNWYGTLRSELIDPVEKGLDVLLDIDVQGALQIKNCSKNDKFLANCVESVFIGPPNTVELERRLRGRGTETDEVIRKRLENSTRELNSWREYDYLLINEDLDSSVNDMVNLLDILHKSTKRLRTPAFIESSE